MDRALFRPTPHNLYINQKVLVTVRMLALWLTAADARNDDGEEATRMMTLTTTIMTMAMQIAMTPMLR